MGEDSCGVVGGGELTGRINFGRGGASKVANAEARDGLCNHEANLWGLVAASHQSNFCLFYILP